MQEIIVDALNKTAYTGILLFEKAFDRVWQNGLLYKMKNMGYNAALIKLIHSFITNRKLRVIINSHISNNRTIKAGVPQGSPLSPILHSIYTADIPKTTSAKTQISL